VTIAIFVLTQICLIGNY